MYSGILHQITILLQTSFIIYMHSTTMVGTQATSDELPHGVSKVLILPSSHHYTRSTPIKLVSLLTLIRMVFTSPYDVLVQLFHPVLVLDVLELTLAHVLLYRVLHINDSGLLQSVMNMSVKEITQLRGTGRDQGWQTSRKVRRASLPPSPFPLLSSRATQGPSPDPGTVP